MSDDGMSDDERSVEAGFELVLPFVVCQSNGGPYDDAAFVAGFQAGQIDRALAIAAIIELREIRMPNVHTGLVPQLELIGMNRGFPVLDAEQTDGAAEWSTVTFRIGVLGDHR